MASQGLLGGGALPPPLQRFAERVRKPPPAIEASQVFGVPLDGLLCMGAPAPKASPPLDPPKGSSFLPVQWNNYI